MWLDDPLYGRRLHAPKIRLCAGLGLMEAGVCPQVRQGQEHPLTGGAVKQMPPLIRALVRNL